MSAGLIAGEAATRVWTGGALVASGGFVQWVFVNLFQQMLAAAGGDPSLGFPLEPERAAPDRETNPQPVALSAWLRQTSDRMLVTVRDVDHGRLVENFARVFPWPEFRKGALDFALSPSERRKPVGGEIGDRDFSGAAYDLLGWKAADADFTPRWRAFARVGSEKFFKSIG